MPKTLARPGQNPGKKTTKRSAPSSELQPYLGQLLAAHRGQRGLTLDALAEATKIDARTIISIEGGKPHQIGKAGLLCEALGIKLADLLQQASEKRASGQSETQQVGGMAITAIAADLDAIDRRIAQAHGGVLSPTRSEEVGFSARRLVSSLSALGIPLDVILPIVEKVPSLLEEMIVGSEPFTTAHIRSAVARAISSLSPAIILSTETFKLRASITGRNVQAQTTSAEDIKFDWTSRYARRYGNPDQIIQVLERDGRAHDLDYAYLKTELLPHAMQRLLGRSLQLSDNRFITGSVISEMAQSVHEEFRRLGLYTVRYKTALLLIEDLALHPPHPWMVTPETRMLTVAYDLERAQASLSYLETEKASDDFEVTHRHNELIHHLCSATLALYGGFLGHRDTSSIHLLKLWLSIESKNVVLWESCDLRYLTGDLAAIGMPKQDLEGLLKRMDPAQHASRRTPARELASSGRRLMDLVSALVEQRRRSILIESKISEGVRVSTEELAILTKQALTSYLGARKVKDLQDSDENHIGFTASVRFEDTILSRRSPLIIVVICPSTSDELARKRAIFNVMDQLEAHRLADVGLIITADPVGAEFERDLRAAIKATPAVIAATSLADLTRLARERDGPVELFDEIFGS